MSPDSALAWPFSSGSRDAQFIGRCFGADASDLNVDFQERTRPSIVTELVTLCIAQSDGVDIASERAWCWTTARRTQALLTIAIRTSGSDLELGVTCPNLACGELLELPIRLTDFEQDNVPDNIQCRTDDGVMLTLRLPNGDDQRRWFRLGLAEDADWAVMATDLITAVDGQPLEAGNSDVADWLKHIEQALQASDPLTDLSIETSCPHCDRHFSVDVDLEKELLMLLEQRQPQLLNEIHSIASAYHWSEEQIMNLRPARRQQYLARIDGDGI
jgi:hypothetical protein